MSLRPHRLFLAALPACAVLLGLAATVSAQEGEADLAADLAAELARERAARIALEQRVMQLERLMSGAPPAAPGDDLDARLRALLPPGDLTPAAQRMQSFPSAYNPQIGVFVDVVAEGGSFDRKLGIDNEKLTVRETEIDFRLPISPWATGVLIATLHDEGDNEFEPGIEEGYADIALGGLFDVDTVAMARLGRFRPMFGRNNRLHRHDWLQAELPLPMRNLLGAEGLIGDGVAFTVPLGGKAGAFGEGSATTLDLAIVDGSMLTGEESLLGEAAGAALDVTGAPLGLDSDSPLATARLAHFAELGPLSDVEFGVSTIQSLGNDAITTSAGTRIDPAYYGLDATWRSRDDETGVGSWLVQAEAIRSQVDFGDVATVTAANPTGPFAPFPFGNERREGWSLTVQRQVSPTVYLGLLLGRSDVLDTGDTDQSVAPYVSWYADEFFRIRAQLERLSRNVAGGPDIHGAWRAIMQFTWNFGAHQPHPYWVNR